MENWAHWPKPAPDIDGCLVSEHELVRYDTSKPSDPEVRWELATVTRMTKKLQRKNPNYYNVRLNSNNLVSKSVELLPGGTWQVWRRNKWWSSSEGRPTPDALAQEEREEQEGARPLEGQEEREQEAVRAPEERPAQDAQEQPPL